MMMKTQLKTYGMQQKQFLKGNLQQYNPTTRNKKNIKQKPNFTPKTTGKRTTKTTTTKNPKFVEGNKS